MEEWRPERFQQNGNGNGVLNGHGHDSDKANSSVIEHHEHHPTNGAGNGHSNAHRHGKVNGNGSGDHSIPLNGTEFRNGESSGASNLACKLFRLSAKDEQTCRSMAANLSSYLQRLEMDTDKEAEFLDNLAYTMTERRSKFVWTSTFAASSVAELITALDSERLNKPTRGDDRKPRLGFIFTGQGAQWYAMGRELIGAYPVFKASIVEAESHLKDFGCTWSLMEELHRDAKTTRVSETLLGMPCCAAVQISLLRLLESWGISPTSVTSHSSGEIAAAYAVGALSFRSAMAACYYRSAATADVTVPSGAMLAVGLGVEGVQPHLKQVKSGIANVACINSPSSVTVSGDVTAVEELEVLLKEHNVFARRLRVNTAYHSHHMAPLSDIYIQGMRDLGVGRDRRSLRPIIYASPTTGTRLTSAEEIGSPEHWAKSMVSPVLFVDAFHEMALETSTGEAIVDIAIEVGPHAALSGPVSDILNLPEYQGHNISYLSCLTRNTSAVDTMQALAGQLVRRGYSVDLTAVNFPSGKRNSIRVLHDLPPYPWNHSLRHWSERRINRAHRNKCYEQHDLLGTMVSGANPHAPSWRHVIRISELPWVRDHTVQGNVVYPGAGYISMAIEAACQFSRMNNGEADISGYRLRDVDIQAALLVPDGVDGIEVHVTLKAVGDKAIGVKDWSEFQIFTASDDNNWTKHCQGLIHVELASQSSSSSSDDVVNPIRASDSRPPKGFWKNVSPADIFAGFRSVGIYHGPVFQNIERVQAGDGQAVSTLVVADVASISESTPSICFCFHC